MLLPRDVAWFSRSSQRSIRRRAGAAAHPRVQQPAAPAALAHPSAPLPGARAAPALGPDPQATTSKLRAALPARAGPAEARGDALETVSL